MSGPKLQTRNPVTWPAGILKSIGLLLAGIIIFLLAGEGVSRLLDLYDRHKEFGSWRKQVFVFRDQSYEVPKSKGTKRILLLGGSAVYDTVEDFRSSWPYFLQKALSVRLGCPVEVVNLAFYTECSSDEFGKLRDFGMKLDPDVVVVFDGFNDVYNLWHKFDYWSTHYRAINGTKHHRLTQLRIDIQKQSSLYQRYKRGIDALTRKLSVTALKAKRQANQETPERKGELNQAAGAAEPPTEDRFFEPESLWPEIKKSYMQIYGANLENMARMIRRSGAEGVFIFQPDLSYKPLLTQSVSSEEKKEYRSIVGRHETAWREIQKDAYPSGLEIMKKIADRYGLRFYDFNELILLRGEVHDLFVGNVHFSDKGRRVITEALTQILLENSLLS